MTSLGKLLRSFFLPPGEVSQELWETDLLSLAKNYLFVSVCGSMLMRLHIQLCIDEGKRQQCMYLHHTHQKSL